MEINFATDLIGKGFLKFSLRWHWSHTVLGRLSLAEKSVLQDITAASELALGLFNASPHYEYLTHEQAHALRESKNGGYYLISKSRSRFGSSISSDPRGTYVLTWEDFKFDTKPYQQYHTDTLGSYHDTARTGLRSTAVEALVESEIRKIPHSLLKLNLS